MFWDTFAAVYEPFEMAVNSRSVKGTGRLTAQHIEPQDHVLECACGTGLISRCIAARCRTLTATDLSENMLCQARKRCLKYENVQFLKADISHINCRDERFDKVVAGNVIHLLPEPEAAVKELLRVCKKGGKVIIPTYIVKSKFTEMEYTLISKMGVNFRKMFTLESYRQFFEDMELQNVTFEVADGVMPCVLAIIEK